MAAAISLPTVLGAATGRGVAHGHLGDRTQVVGGESREVGVACDGLQLVGATENEKQSLIDFAQLPVSFRIVTVARAEAELFDELPVELKKIGEAPAAEAETLFQ